MASSPTKKTFTYQRSETRGKGCGAQQLTSLHINYLLALLNCRHSFYI